MPRRPAAAPVPPPAPRRLRVGRVAALAAVAAALTVAAWELWVVATPPPPAFAPGSLPPELERAVGDARRSVERSKRAPEAWGRYGMLLWANRLLPESVASLEVARRLDPADARWPYLIGLTRIHTAPAEAAPLLREAVAAPSPPGEAYRAAARLRLAELLADQGDAPAAEELFRAQLGVRPDDARANLGLGQLLLAREDLAGAAACLRKAVGSISAARKANGGLALAARLAGQPASDFEREASRPGEDAPWPDPFVEQVLRFTITDADTPTDRASKRAASGDHAAAVPLFREALRAEPGRLEARLGLARSLAELAKRERGDVGKEALAEYGRVLEQKPDHAAAAVEQGELLLALGDAPGAVAALERAARARPDVAAVHAALAKALEAVGRPDEAKRRMREAGRVVGGGR